jgi:hypothetical protein
MTEKISNKLTESKFSDERFLSVSIIFLAFFLGIVVRWNFIAGSDYPINDGGLFYAMISDLVANKFVLPEYTTYNFASIPISYPPLAFYIIGGLNVITGIPILTLMHYLPFGISVLTIPVFYAASKIFFPKNQFSRSLATLFFATLPRSFEWFVMGGGITRSLGFIFALLALTFYAQGIRKQVGGIDLVLAVVFSTFTVLSHPVAGIFLAFSILVITVYYWPVKIVIPIAILFFVIIVSSPWWLSVIIRHGVDPFIGAANTGHSNWLNAGYLLTLNFNYENRFFLRLVSFLAIMGLFSSKRRESIFLGILVGMGYIVVPRGGIDLLTSFLVMLSALGFSVLSKAWNVTGIDLEMKGTEPAGLSMRSRIFLFFLIIYTSIGAYSYKYIDGKASLGLRVGDYQSMIWIRDNTHQEARVLHLPPGSYYQDWWNDYFGEWMPVFTIRRSVATVQGYEWLPGEFGQRIEQYNALRSCTGSGAKCIHNWVKTYGTEFDYLLLCKREHPEIVIENILGAMDNIVYENEDVIILEWLEGPG